MNERKFLEQYAYALEYDFTSSSEEPAAWAPKHPRYWSQGMAQISLDRKQARLPSVLMVSLLQWGRGSYPTYFMWVRKSVSKC
jgi:hypothetical protein